MIFMAKCLFRINIIRHFSRGPILRTMSGKFEAVLIDLSGTVHIEDNAIPGSQEAIKRLRQSSLKLRFVTNTTKEPLRILHDRLQKLGFDIRKDEIFTSLTAARAFVESKQVRPLLMLEEDAKEDFAGIETKDPNAVVVGLAPSCFNYDTMNEAFRLLMSGAPLIAIHKARYFKRADGNLHIGPGAFVNGLEFSTGTKAEVVGKPEAGFFLSAIQDLGVTAAKTVMIGDDAKDDVKGAIDAGMMGILVKTGKYRPDDETKFSPTPTATLSDFSAAVDYILSQGTT